MMIRNWICLSSNPIPPYKHNPSEAFPVPSKPIKPACIFLGKGKKLADTSLLPLLSLVEKNKTECLWPLCVIGAGKSLCPPGCAWRDNTGQCGWEQDIQKSSLWPNDKYLIHSNHQRSLQVIFMNTQQSKFILLVQRWQGSRTGQVSVPCHQMQKAM